MADAYRGKRIAIVFVDFKNVLQPVEHPLTIPGPVFQHKKLFLHLQSRGSTDAVNNETRKAVSCSRNKPQESLAIYRCSFYPRVKKTFRADCSEYALLDSSLIVSFQAVGV